MQLVGIPNFCLKLFLKFAMFFELPQKAQLFELIETIKKIFSGEF